MTSTKDKVLTRLLNPFTIHDQDLQIPVELKYSVFCGYVYK